MEHESILWTAWAVGAFSGIAVWQFAVFMHRFGKMRFTICDPTTRALVDRWVKPTGETVTVKAFGEVQEVPQDGSRTWQKGNRRAVLVDWHRGHPFTLKTTGEVVPFNGRKLRAIKKDMRAQQLKHNGKYSLGDMLKMVLVAVLIFGIINTVLAIAAQVGS